MDRSVITCKRKKLKSDQKVLLLLLFPFLVFLIAFHYVPLFGWVYAFFDYEVGVPLFSSEFVGMKNFIRIFGRGWRDVRQSLGNTLIFSFLNILTTPLPVIFAIMVNEAKNTRFRKLVQTATTLPNFISWVLVYCLVYALFSTESGMVNKLLSNMGSNVVVDPLGNPDAVYMFQTILGVWKSIGWSAIVYIAAITGLDAELYDAAAVDGAGRFRQIWHITIPGIMPTYLVLLLLAISNILSNGFERYFVFYNGLIAEKINVLDYYIYYVGFRLDDYSYSIALGMWKTVVSLLLLGVANFAAKKIRGEGIV